MSLILRDIRHSFGSTIVVDGASIEVAPGEIVCLFGPSGCGKTTLLRIAAGLERLQHGAIELDGATLATPHLDTPPERRRIGFVFQDFVLFPHMTIAENVGYGRAASPAQDRRARIDAELAAVGLAEFGDRRPHQLSGGQQQRAALARAFATEPRAMLLDEPFASIDAVLRQRLRSEMRLLLKARSTPTILVTHDPDEAVELGDRVAIMSAGRIIETAAPEKLFHSPKTVEGARLFAGSQVLACEPVEAGVATAFGAIAPLDRPKDASRVVLHDGAVEAVASPSGAYRVVDCRFGGPHFVVTIAAENRPDQAIRAVCQTALPISAPVAIRIDPAKARPLA